MTRNLREEVDIAPYVERGVVDVHDPAVRDNINTLLTGALGQCFITPYIALEKVRKVLAYYHIFLPKTTFLEGDRGVEVFDIKQFGELAGMRNNGDVVTRVDGSQNLYFEYKMNDKGMYDIFCEIVTDEELDDLVDNVEDEINDEDVEDNREEKLDESSESVDMAGPETGTKPYPGGPEVGMAIVAAIMKKKKDELKEDTKERDAAWKKILSKKKDKSEKENPNPARVAHFLNKMTGKSTLEVVKEEDKKKVY